MGSRNMGFYPVYPHSFLCFVLLPLKKKKFFFNEATGATKAGPRDRDPAVGEVFLGEAAQRVIQPEKGKGWGNQVSYNLGKDFVKSDQDSA